MDPNDGIRKRLRDEVVEAELLGRCISTRPWSTLLSLDTLFNLGRSSLVAGRDARSEVWSVYGWLGRSQEFAFFASFKSFAIPQWSIDSFGNESIPTKVHFLHWGFIDPSRNAYYRFSQMDHSGSAALAALMAENPGTFSEDSCLGEAVVEQLQLKNLILPDKLFSNGCTSESGMVNLLYGDSSLKCTRQHANKMSFELQLCGQTNEGKPLSEEINLSLKVSFIVDSLPVLDGDDKGNVSNGLQHEKGFRYFVPACRVSQCDIRGTRADDRSVLYDQRMKNGSIWLEHEMIGVLGKSFREVRFLREMSLAGAHSPTFVERCCLTLFADGEHHISATRIVDSKSGDVIESYALVQHGKGTKPVVYKLNFQSERTKQYRSPITGVFFSTHWSLSLHSDETGKMITVELQALLNNQEFVSILSNPSYWLGAVIVTSGTMSAAGEAAEEVSGMGFIGVHRKRSAEDAQSLFHILHSSGVNAVERECNHTLSLKDQTSSAALSGASSMAVVLQMQGCELTETHKMILTTLLTTYEYIFHHKDSEEKITEALDWCFNKWMGLSNTASIDYFSVLLRAFMLNELQHALKMTNTLHNNHFKNNFSVIDALTPPYLSGRVKDVSSTGFSASTAEEPSDMNAAVASATFTGKWTEVQERHEGSLRNLLLHEGAPLFWRFSQLLVRRTLTFSVDQKSKTLIIKQTSSFSSYTWRLPLDGTEVEWICFGRGELKTRAFLMLNGSQICLVTRMRNGVEEVRYSSTGGQKLKESTFFFSFPDESRPIAWTTRSYALADDSRGSAGVS